MRDSMKNIIEFYYNIRIDKLHNKDGYYFFNIGSKSFILKPYNDNEARIQNIFKLSTLIENQIKFDHIILNRNNILNLPSISNISNVPITSSKELSNLERNNWEILWSNKIDYYEMQIMENKKKYPLIRESFDYFVGMGENAISYLVNTKLEAKPTMYDNKVPSHNNLNESLYDPSNIISDHKARDVAEYIKYCFWHNNIDNLFPNLDEYFRHNYYSAYGIRVLFARLIYPSFYFNIYDQIITGKEEESALNPIIDRITDYEYYLYSIYLYFLKYYDIPPIEWLKK